MRKSADSFGVIFLVKLKCIVKENHVKYRTLQPIFSECHALNQSESEEDLVFTPFDKCPYVLTLNL